MNGASGALLDAERHWLAPVAEPFARRAAALAWSPDPFDAYCDRCGADIGPHEHAEFGCALCFDRRFRWARIVRLGAYDGPLRDWVLEVKFHRFRSLAISLGESLGERMLDAGLDPAGVVVAPCPTTRRRRASRGIDHAGSIATGVGRALRAPVARPLRRSHAPSQRAVAYSGREANVRGRFRPSLGWSAGGSWLARDARAVVLVDDVRTSGATLRAAARALRRVAWRGAAPEVWAGVVAVAREPGRRRQGEVDPGGSGGSSPPFIHIDSSPA